MLPDTVRVKLSSEAAEAISVTPVVIQEIAIRELIGHLLGVAGKDEGRVRELLLRGTLVSGASRFRWTGWDAAVEDLRALLATFPDPDPTLPFAAERCVRAVLRGGRHAIEIPREAGERKGLFQREAFWDALMALAAGASYAGYSYRERADRYMREWSADEAERIRAASGGLRYSSLREQIRAASFTAGELFVPR